MKVADDYLIIIGQFNAACRLIVIERFFNSFKHFYFLLILLVAALHIFARAFNPLLHTIKVSKNQLQIDCLNVADRVDFAVYVCDILIFKAANNMNNRIHFTNMSQKFISETLTFTSAANQTSNIHKFKRCWYSTIRNNQLSQFIQTFVRYFYHAYVRINCTKWIVGRFCTRLCNCIKQCGFPYIRKAHDSRL
ncbi:hypothetical protein D3C81_1037490 [compost metagenome]